MLANVALLAIVGIGLNVLIGLTGQVSFGHVGFYAIGAYAVAILTTKARLELLARLAARRRCSPARSARLLALPALRVQGPVPGDDHDRLRLHRRARHRRDGAASPAARTASWASPRPALGALASGERAVALLAIARGRRRARRLSRWLSRGTWGAAMRAVRDSETAAESIGLDPLAIKTRGLRGLGRAAPALAGGLFAPLSGFVTPQHASASCSRSCSCWW